MHALRSQGRKLEKILLRAAELNTQQQVHVCVCV
jgi:hypothetical protein